MKLVIPTIALVVGTVGLTATMASYGQTTMRGRNNAQGSVGAPLVGALPASPKGTHKGRPYATLDLHWPPDTTAKTDAAPNSQNSQLPSLRWVKLGKVPVIKLGPQKPISHEEAAQIKQLIASLASIDSPDLAPSPTLSGTAFAPVAGSEHAGMLLLTNHQIKTSGALRKLVAMGPRALPFLLAGLDDRTPTRLIIRHNTFGMGGMGFSHEIWGNPVSAAEQKALASVPKSRWGATRSPSDLVQLPAKSGNPWEATTAYTVTIGDICFVAIGQIGGRGYEAVRYQPTANIVINSPVHDPALSAQVRAIWSSKNPAQHLLDSLLLDYATEGVFNGRSLDGWDVGSELQIAAAMRLLYYFSRQTTPMIAKRLQRLRVVGHGPGGGSMHTEAELNAWMKQDVANGVRADQFVKAVSWCKEPAIRAALLVIFKRTTDPDVLLACLPGLGQGNEQLVRTRLEVFLSKLPATEGGPYGDGYNILVALGNCVGERAKPIFKRYLQAPSPQRCLSLCQALRQTRQNWDLELLAPLLVDTRPVGWTYPVDPRQSEPTLPIRVCDEAAETLNMNHPGLPFKMAGTHKDLDRQIEIIRERIRGGQR